MRLYQVRVRGSSFVMQMAEGVRLTKGFLVTRWVEAQDEGGAAQAAIAMVRSDRRLAGQLSVRLVAEEVEEVSGGAAEGNRSGFAFYDMGAPPD